MEPALRDGFGLDSGLGSRLDDFACICMVLALALLNGFVHHLVLQAHQDYGSYLMVRKRSGTRI